MSERHAVIVGAGPAGIAAAVALKDRGIRPTVVDQAESVASSWRRRDDRLRLNTCRPLSHLPRRRFPRGTPMFPSRDQLIEHIERHAGEDGIEMKLGTRVDRIDRADGRWALDTSAGELRAPQVITATGYEQESATPSRASGRSRISAI
jgi:cation diffusion facilitator CzcD-associated flavoprotein CzcO